VQGLPKHLDLKSILKACRKNFHCNGALVEDEKGEVIIQLQGDMRLIVKKFFVDMGICRGDEIVLHGH
jgi:translation initiation factor SUI1